MDDLITRMQFSTALTEIWKLVGECNSLHPTLDAALGARPQRRGQERLNTVLYVLAECCREVAVLITPFMPRTPARIFEQLGVTDPRADRLGLRDEVRRPDRRHGRAQGVSALPAH